MAKTNRDKRRAARRAARKMTAGELRERAASLRDRATRAQLAQADSLRTNFWITNTRHLRLPTVLKEPRTVTYPLGGTRTVPDDPRAAVHTAVELVQPWTPAPGDPVLEGPWGGSGGWTADLVREWVAEAMETLRACPLDHPSGCVSSMPDIVREAVLSYGWSDATILILPSPAALGRLDVVLQWLFLLDDVDQRKAVVGVAMGLPLRRIGRMIGRSHTHAATLERKAIEQLVTVLNEG